MTDSLREDLLGYLLGALDEPRQAEVERRLAEDAQAQRELAVLNRALAPLDATREEYDPPADLAARTCRFVAQQALAEPSRPEPAATVRRRLSGMPMHADERLGETEGRFRWQDVVTTAGVIVAASILLFPAIHGSRMQARLVECQDNLRELGTVLASYSDFHEGFFPRVPAQGNLAVASAYAPLLAESQLLPDDQVVVCPGSRLAEMDSFHIPTLEEIEAAQLPEEIRSLQETMGGSYGYVLGYQDDEQYRATRNLRRATFALLADAPSNSSPNRMSENHGRLGQNVLFEDGHVAFTTSPQPSDFGGDNFFVNDNGDVAPGLSVNDSVIGAGATSPIQCLSQ